MESEHYKLGFKDGSEGAPRREFSCLVWQDMYNQGYNDARRGLELYLQPKLQHLLRRGGC